MKRVRLLIQGRVQGVGFRAFARARAHDLGIRGAARNRPDGAVEVEAEGSAEALASFVEALRVGPRGAAVRAVEEAWSDGPPRHDSFEITR